LIVFFAFFASFFAPLREIFKRFTQRREEGRKERKERRFSRRVFVPIRAVVLLIGIAALTAGCSSQNNTPTGGDANVENLPTLQPTSGGEMVRIPAGNFTMGSAEQPDETSHQVTVRAFFIDKFPVTQDLYEKIMGVNPSKRKAKDNPVERTQWTDAARFCNKCSEVEGLKPCYDLQTWSCDYSADGYRLPTEAEWEYACRAGSSSKYCFGDSEAELSRYAWFKPGSEGKTRPAGQKLPNRWGLLDMHGNVWQWCNDWYAEDYYTASPSDDPTGPTAGKQRVLRGGAWDSTPDKCRSAYRHKEFPVYSDACFGADSYGFRRVRNAGPIDAFVNPTVAAVKPGNAATPVGARSGDRAPTGGPPVGARSPDRAPARAGKIDPAKLKGTIIFVSDRSGTLKIWSMHASGKDTKQLTLGNDADADPRFSPDGKRILYTTLRGGFPEIWLMNRDGSDAKSITKGSQGSWSPDGKSILFIRDNQTYVREMDAGKEKRITPEKWERCGVPAFSPDGKHIAVASRHLGDIGIFIVSADGKEQRQLKAEEPCCTPCWSKDGKRILCQTVQGHIHQVDAGGGNWEQVTFGADVQHDARYSPDGSMIFFCRAPTPEGPWQICVKALDGDDLDFVQLTKEGSNMLPDWHE
jgi:formylglycine-generating enzyme required for sulfatase activity